MRPQVLKWEKPICIHLQFQNAMDWTSPDPENVRFEWSENRQLLTIHRPVNYDCSLQDIARMQRQELEPDTQFRAKFWLRTASTDEGADEGVEYFHGRLSWFAQGSKSRLVREALSGAGSRDWSDGEVVRIRFEIAQAVTKVRTDRGFLGSRQTEQALFLVIKDERTWFVDRWKRQHPNASASSIPILRLGKFQLHWFFSRWGSDPTLFEYMSLAERQYMLGLPRESLCWIVRQLRHLGWIRDNTLMVFYAGGRQKGVGMDRLVELYQSMGFHVSKPASLKQDLANSHVDMHGMVGEFLQRCEATQQLGKFEAKKVVEFAKGADTGPQKSETIPYEKLAPLWILKVHAALALGSPCTLPQGC